MIEHRSATQHRSISPLHSPPRLKPFNEEEFLSQLAEKGMSLSVLRNNILKGLAAASH
jgi:hypothetical protein